VTLIFTIIFSIFFSHFHLSFGYCLPLPKLRVACFFSASLPCCVVQAPPTTSLKKKKKKKKPKHRPTKHSSFRKKASGHSSSVFKITYTLRSPIRFATRCCAFSPTWPPVRIRRRTRWLSRPKSRTSMPSRSRSTSSNISRHSSSSSSSIPKRHSSRRHLQCPQPPLLQLVRPIPAGWVANRRLATSPYATRCPCKSPRSPCPRCSRRPRCPSKWPRLRFRSQFLFPLPFPYPFLHLLPQPIIPLPHPIPASCRNCRRVFRRNLRRRAWPRSHHRRQRSGRR